MRVVAQRAVFQPEIEIVPAAARGADKTAAAPAGADRGGEILGQEAGELAADAEVTPGRRVAIGAEGVTNPTPEITVTNNDFRNDGDYQTALVRNITATPATLKGNKLAGSVIPLKGDGNVQ